jgi:UDP-glucose 4-epimerase
LINNAAVMNRPASLSPYAAGKLAGEMYVRVYAQTMGVDGACLRYFNIFGPRQDPSSPYSGVISIFFKKMMAGERPMIYGDGGQTRDFTFVANVVDANLRALDSATPIGGSTMNVGTGDRISLLDLVNAINEILGTSIEPIFQPEREGDVRDSQACLELTRKTLGYEPLVDFRKGLRRTYESLVKPS